MTAALQTHSRWMIARDLPAAAAICVASRGVLRGDTLADTEARFLAELRKRPVIGFAAEDRLTDRVTGYMVYRHYGDHLHLIDLCVGRPYRRRGVGRDLVEKLAEKAKTARRDRATAYVPASRVAMSQLLKAAGWRCVDLDGDDLIFELEVRS